MPLAPSIAHQWYDRSAKDIAPALIGCTLVRQFSDGMMIRGMIVETEAYEPDDPAMHAYRGKTPRNEVMFGPAGRAYVYQIYGLYHCLNVVTDREGIASAVLIRALQLETAPPGIELAATTKLERLAAGPGKLCRVLRIERSLNGTLLSSGQALWLEHRPPQLQQQLDTGQITLTQTTRIGLTKGVELPYRWYLSGAAAVSKR